MRLTSLLAAALVALTPAIALGQEPSAAEIAVARKLFGEASALEAEKQWGGAEAKLREAVKIKETPGLRYHLGYCLEQQQKLVAALVEYDRAQELLDSGTKAPDVAELVGPAREGVKKRVSSVTLKLPADVESVEVRIDGVVMKAAVIDKAIPVDPGDRIVSVSSPGRQAFRRELSIGEAEAREVEVDLPRLGNTKGGFTPAAGDEPVDEGASASTSGMSTRTWVLIAEGAFTVLAIGGGVYFTLQKGHASDQADAALAEVDRKSGNNPSACADKVAGVEQDCAQLAEFTDDRDRFKTLSTVSFIGAGVGVAALVTTFLVWKPSSPKSEARIVPHVRVGSRAAFAGISGSF